MSQGEGGTFRPAERLLHIEQKGDAMNGELKKQEPEIMPPVPVVEPERNIPEVPPDKDAPEKKGPTKAEA